MRNHFRKLPIVKKLQLINLAILSVVTILTTMALGTFMYQSLLHEYQENTATTTKVLSGSLEAALLFNDAKAIREALSNLKQIHDIEQVRVYDSSNHILASYTRADSPLLSSPATSTELPPSKMALGQMKYQYALPIKNSYGSQEQIGMIVAIMDLRSVYRKLAYQIGTLLLSSLLGFTLISMLLTRSQRLIAQPLIDLSDTMRKVTREADFSVRAKITNQDEIGELTAAFNRMIDELSKRNHSLNKELHERKIIEGKLSEIAHIDPVTKLPNRHSYNNQISKLLFDFEYVREKFVLMFIDLDNFKYINDTFGHHAGDTLLAESGKRLRSSIREEDFVARLGGDEFVVLIRQYSDSSSINTVAEKILKAISHPFIVEEHEAFIGASIGITICANNVDNQESLQRQADSAMYQAKRLGKNNFQYFKAEQAATNINRVSLEAQLRRSLERNEIVVYYQPIFEIQNMRIVGFEALVRWFKLDGTVVSPDDFIPLAEEIGFIREIGSHVTKVATRQMAEWIDLYGATFIAVNFSSKQFKQHHLTEEVLKSLVDSGLEYCHFEMEITESVLMDNTTDSKDMLTILNKQGISISIDDFGTGYSSLSYLTNFPVNKLKIDKSFVNKLPHDTNSLAVVSAITSLACSLNLKVVAEGIETAEQLSCLEKMGCTYGQGYILSKPVSAEEAGALLALRNSNHS